MYLVRHDQVDMSGICYGQSDVDSTILYSASADAVRPLLANKVKHVYSSPLKRCFKLANSLFADYEIQTNNALMEVNFGQWEQRAWDDIPRSSLDVWAQSPTNFQFPQGEHLNDFYQRVASFWLSVQADHDDICIVSHAGVIRILMSLFLERAWQDCLSIPVPFLSVTEINAKGSVLLNP